MMAMFRSGLRGRSFRRDERGATTIEYVLIAAIVSIVIIGSSGSIRSALIATFTNVSNGVGSTNAAM